MKLLIPWRTFKKVCRMWIIDGCYYAPITSGDIDTLVIRRCRPHDCPILKRYGVKK